MHLPSLSFTFSLTRGVQPLLRWGGPIVVVCLCLIGFAARAMAESPAVIGSPLARVAVGPGAAESSIRQVVRTPDGYVYIAAVDDQGGPADGFTQNTYLHMYKSTTSGLPVAFKEVNRVRRPRVGRNATLSGGDMRLDRNGIIHLVYYRTTDGATVYRQFDTNTDEWGKSPTSVTTFSGRAGIASYGARGRVINALALDRENTPFIMIAGDDGVKVFRKEGAGWVEEIFLSTLPAIHPALTFDRLNRLHVAWLEDYENESGSAIRYALREGSGVWNPAELVFSEDANVLSNETLDQSPSIAVDSQNQPVVLYLSGRPGQPDNFIHTRTRIPDLWIADDPPEVSSHTPGLYMRGDVKFVLLGHDGALHPGYLTHTPVDADWSAVVHFQPDEPFYAYDGSASARYDPQYEVDCSVVDVVYSDETSDVRGGFKPDLYYVVIKLTGGAPCREVVN